MQRSIAWIVSTGCILLIGCTRSPEIGLHPGDYAPVFELQDLNKISHTLTQYRGQVVVLNFWASWCAPCLEELPALEKLYTNLKEKGLLVLSVGVDDEPEALQKIKQQVGISFPILLDSQGTVKRRYKVKGYPETFVIDSTGKMTLFSDPEQGLPTVRMKGPRQWDSLQVVNNFITLLNKTTP